RLPTPPDGGWGWMVVFGSFMIHVVADGVAYSFGVFLPTFLEYFDSPRSETAWLGSLMIGVTWGSGPIGSIMTNRFGCRATTCIGSILSAAAFILSIFAPNIWFMYFSFGILAGLGLGLIYLPAIVIVTFYFEKKRSFATGLAVCGSGIGTFIFAPLSQFLVDQFGWKGAVLIEAGILLNCCVFGLLFRPLALDPAVESDEKPAEVELVNKNLSALAASEKTMTSVPSLPQAVKLDAEPVRPFTSELMLHRSHESHKKEVSPFARKDAFYSGSLRNIPLYRSNPGMYTQSMASLPVSESSKGSQGGKCSSVARCLRHQSRHLALLKDPVFLLFTVSNFLTSLGFCVPYIYLPDLAHQLGIGRSEGAFLISIVGIANTVGRVVFGWMSDLKCVNRLVLYNTVLTLCGICTALCSFCVVYPMLAAYAAAFGMFIGVYVGLTSVVLVDLLGLEKLTNAFGLLLLFQGAAAVVGPPIAGKMYDLRGNYDDAFYLMGALVALSGLMLFALPFIQK
ncbi:hypothetical protein CAPTEDRAFT_62745, partial [Capitella teleta]